MRSGLLTRKVGMTRLYLEDGQHCPVTVFALEGCEVVGQRTIKRDGYVALRVGAGDVREKRVAKPQRVEAEKAGTKPHLHIREFRVTPENLIEVGGRFRASHFVIGQYVDASSVSIGKGFAGAMKRHHFSGLRASHGVSVSHRSHGSTGNSQDPGRVFKGKKMAGHMGDRRRTVQNLEVVSIDDERGIILVKGGVPGAHGTWVELRDAKKRALPPGAPFPAGLENDSSVSKETEEVVDADKETEFAAEAPAGTPLEEAITEPSVETPAKEEKSPSEDEDRNDSFSKDQATS